MAEYLRVKDKGTGHEYTIRAEHFHAAGHKRLDKDPLGLDGTPRPPKYRVALGEDPAPSAAPASPARRTGSRRGRRAASDPVTPDPDAGHGAPETDDGQPAESDKEND